MAFGCQGKIRGKLRKSNRVKGGVGEVPLIPRAEHNGSFAPLKRVVGLMKKEPFLSDESTFFLLTSRVTIRIIYV
jgi:hypothetical protein